MTNRRTVPFGAAAMLLLACSRAQTKNPVVTVSDDVSLRVTQLGVGPAIIRRGKDVLQQDRSITGLGGAVGLAIRIPLAPHVGLSLSV